MSERKQRSPSVLQPQILCGQSVSLCTEKKTTPSRLVIITVPRGLYVEPVVFFKSLSCVLWLNVTALVLLQLFSPLFSQRVLTRPPAPKQQRSGTSCQPLLLYTVLKSNVVLFNRYDAITRACSMQKDTCGVLSCI